MSWNIPGTVLSIDQKDAKFVEQQFCAMFLGGGMVLSQITAVTGLEPYTVQNWVKRGFLPAPEHKRYNMNQLCRIVTINMLKSTLSMEKITGLISYVNGALDDTSDDIIDDAKLFFRFVRLASRLGEMHDDRQRQLVMEEELADYRESVVGARERVEKVLRVMLVAWTASKLQQQADTMVNELV